MEKRFLTKKEIQTIVSNVTDSCFFKDQYASQLKTVYLNPRIIPELIRTLKEKHNQSLVRPGTNVGIIAAQSIGERFTQSTLNTFHQAGLLISGATKGIPRVEELLNASKNPKSIFYRLKPGVDTKGLQAITLKCLTKTIRVIQMENYAWRDVFHKMYGIGLDVGEEVLQIELDRQMLFEHEITHYDFVQKIPCCEIDPEMKFLYVPKHIDMSTLIQGVAGISRVIGGTVIETHKSQFHYILSMDPQARSSHVWDIYNVLGIEAAREYLLQEVVSETTGIHVSHLSILVDKMTFTGDVYPVNRHSMRKDNIGVFAKASFEESFSHFITAAVNEETDNTNGLSASIVCGKKYKF